jgi:hypothetical protein
MPEGLGQSSSGSFDSHDPALHADVHALTTAITIKLR